MDTEKLDSLNIIWGVKVHGTMKPSQIRWLGHLVRINEEITLKRI